MSKYFRTDTSLDLIETLELTSEFLNQSEADERYWKWYINALHSAVQSTASLAIENGNGFLVQKPKIATQMMKADTKTFNSVSPCMDTFINLVRKSLDKSNLRDSAVPLEVDSCIAALTSMNELRNEFTHFNVKSWSIEFMLILEKSAVAANYIEHFTVRTPAILWHDEEHQQRAAISVEKLRSLIHLRLKKHQR
jgi:hypothetical protein